MKADHLLIHKYIISLLNIILRSILIVQLFPYPTVFIPSMT